MRKFKRMLPVAAILLAIITTAFTSKRHVPVAKADEQELYWYPVDDQGMNIDHTQQINSTKETKTDLLNNEGIPCTPGSSFDCVRGFTVVQTTDNNSSGDDSVPRQ